MSGPREGIDFGGLSEADVAMLRHASALAPEEDFSRFYIDDDGPDVFGSANLEACGDPNCGCT